MAAHANSIVTWIGHVVRSRPQHPALIEDGTTWTYAQLWSRSGAIARGLLSGGLQPGQSVGIVGENEAAYIATYFGILRAGGAAVPVNAMLDPTSMCRQLKLVDPAAVFVGRVDATAHDALAGSFQVLPLTGGFDQPGQPRFPLIGPNTVCAVMLTSGSTGAPKGAVHTHGSMLHGALQLASTFPFGPNERGVLFLPLYACIPEQVLPTLLTGGSLEILPRFDIERVADACTRATMLDAVPTALSRLIEHAPLDSLRQLNWVLFASETMPVPLLKRWWEELPSVLTHQFYGMTEILPLTAATHDLLKQDPTTVGQAFATSAVTVQQDGTGVSSDGSGELVGSSPARMRGYFGDSAATKDAFAGSSGMRTGDLGRIDERGFVYLTGRLKDIIISGGINIAPREIEDVASSCPGIESSTVIGIPSDAWGETPVVIGVPKRGHPVTAADLLRHCRQGLTGYKRPTGAGLVVQLPTTGIGKAAKDAIRQMILNGEIALVRS